MTCSEWSASELSVFILGSKTRTLPLSILFTVPGGSSRKQFPAWILSKANPGEESVVRCSGTASLALNLLLFRVDGCKPLSDLHFLCAEANGIVVTGQDGLVHHLKAGATGIQQIQSRKQHELETWCVEVSRMDSNLVLSGADDSLLRGWDLRTPNASPAFSNRSHEAGVISLACNPNKDVQLLTGSYDEHVRLFDLRHMKAPLLRSNRLGDGAYQLSWHSQKCGLFAVAAMRCGFPIFELKDGDEGDEGEAAAFNALGGYCEAAKEGSHGSLGYGISWQTLGGSVVLCTALYHLVLGPSRSILAVIGLYIL